MSRSMNQILRAIGRWLCARGWHRWRQDPWPEFTAMEYWAWALDGKRTATCLRCGQYGVKYSGWR